PRARCQLFPKGSLPLQARGRGGKALVHKLLPHAIPGMEIDRMELAAGERMAGIPHRPGTHEYLYCEDGALTLWVAGQRFDLGPGDVAAFPGDQAHTYANAGARPAVGFSVVTLAPIGGTRPARARRPRGRPAPAAWTRAQPDRGRPAAGAAAPRRRGGRSRRRPGGAPRGPRARPPRRARRPSPTTRTAPG